MSRCRPRPRFSPRADDSTPSLGGGVVQHHTLDRDAAWRSLRGDGAAGVDGRRPPRVFPRSTLEDHGERDDESESAYFMGGDWRDGCGAGGGNLRRGSDRVGPRPGARSVLRELPQRPHAHANLSFEALSLDEVSGDAAVWEKVVRKLRSRAMPPAGRPRPDEASYDALASFLGDDDRSGRRGCAQPGPAEHPSLEPNGVRERGSRHAGAGGRCARAVAGRRHGRARVRQQRRGADDFPSIV